MKNLSLNTKLMAIVALFTISGSTIAYVGITRMAAINDSLNEIVHVLNRRVLKITAVQDQFTNLMLLEKNYIIEQSKQGMDEYGRQMEAGKDNLDKLTSEYNAMASEEGRRKMGEVLDTFRKWWMIDAEIRRLSYDNDNKQAYELSRTKGREMRKAVEKELQEIIDLNIGKMDQKSKETDVEYADARRFMLTLSFSAIFIGLGAAIYVLRSTSKAIDLVIHHLDESSSQVGGASSTIAAASEQLSQAATEQAASLEETATAIEELNTMIQKSAENAKNSSSAAVSSQEGAAKGKKAVEEVIEAIQGISTSNEEMMREIGESNQKISEIVKVIEEIGSKTKIINDIVFQTRLLSFNASVEAARAGEQGKGFAVVAEEVGSLAQMSGNAAKEITALLDESTQKVQSIVTEMSGKVERLTTDGKTRLAAGVQIAGVAGESIEQILGNVTHVAQMAAEIAAASQEQSQGVQEITKAMAQLDQVTQENASSATEAAQSSESLSAQADALRKVVDALVVTIKGGENHEQGIHDYHGNAGGGTPSARPAARSSRTPAARAANVQKKAALTAKVEAHGASVPVHADKRFEEVA